MHNTEQTTDKNTTAKSTAGKVGLKDGRLTPCSHSNNCVSSQSSNTKQLLSPFTLKCGIEKSRQFLISILKDYKNAEIITNDRNYIHAEFRSSFFKFVDDVEFYLDEEDRQVHFKSASRVGLNDFGANRNRMKDISTKYHQCMQFYQQALNRRESSQTTH